ncbi:MAG TPA: hypothetical protein VFQ91_12280 [Bryobacteraceae bacterium]|nr:hypothetical protein [Bryobacteraceae bacterium]
MRFFISNHVPPFDRVAIVESGSRQLLEDLLPVLYKAHGDGIRLDLITCYAGEPKAFRPERGEVYRITNYNGHAGREQLLAELRQRHYSITGIVCSGEPIMTKWKWMLALRLPGKVFLLNENGDYVWVDRGHLSILIQFLLVRLDLAGAGAVLTLGRILLFPLSFFYLLAFAGVVHLRRKARA